MVVFQFAVTNSRIKLSTILLSLKKNIQIDHLLDLIGQTSILAYILNIEFTYPSNPETCKCNAHQLIALNPPLPLLNFYSLPPSIPSPQTNVGRFTTVSHFPQLQTVGRMTKYYLSLKNVIFVCYSICFIFVFLK